MVKASEEEVSSDRQQVYREVKHGMCACFFRGGVGWGWGGGRVLKCLGVCVCTRVCVCRIYLDQISFVNHTLGREATYG